MKKLVTTNRFRHNLTFDVRGCHVNLLYNYVMVTDESVTSNRTFLTHQHSHTEIHYVLEGTCDVVCPDACYTLTPGQLLLVPPGSPHRMSQEEPMARLIIALQMYPPTVSEEDPSPLHFYSTLQPSAPVLLEPGQHEELRSSLEQLHRHHLVELGKRPDPLLNDKFRANATLLLYALHDAMPSSPGKGRRSTDRAVTRQQLYIEDHFAGYCDNNSRAELLANRLHMSTRQLSRTLKSSFGMNFRQKNNATRLELAQHLLADTDLSVSKIAEDLGYSSSTTFGTFIRSQTGLSPTQLRRMLRDKE